MDRFNQAEQWIIALLAERGVQFRVHHHVAAPTFADIVQVLPFPQERFLKAVAFRVKSGPWILATCRGEDRVDYRKLAEAVGVKRAELVRPAPEEVEQALGYAIGGVCPIPPNGDTRTIVDADIAATTETVFCGIGRNERTLEIGIADLITVANALVAPIVQQTSSVV
jgi:Cys-tRNA(Pro)/Cys-tRNA(Cys) deacylase